MNLRSIVDMIRSMWENLNERERKLVAILSGVLLVLGIMVPLVIVTISFGEAADRNELLLETLRDLERDRSKFVKRIADRKKAELRYASVTPSLAGLIEEKARSLGIQIRGDITEQPEKKEGRWRRRGVRVRLPNVGLRPWVQLLSALESTSYPVAIDLLKVEHFQTGDQYDVEIGLVAFDKQKTNESIVAHGDSTTQKEDKSE